VANELNGSRAESGPGALPPLTAVAAGAIVGLVLLLAAWMGASDQRDSADQMAWLNLGLAGVLVTGGVCGSWVLRGRRTVEARLSRILSGVDPPALDGGREPVQVDRLVTALKMTRYHIPECLLVDGKTLSADTRDTHERAGLRPCEMCRP
jgi:hypothetical protein